MKVRRINGIRFAKKPPESRMRAADCGGSTPATEKQEARAMTFIMAKKSVAAAGLLSLLLLAGAGESQAQRKGRDLETVKGKVRSFTEAPKGEKDGMVLSDGTVVHWPPHLADRFTAVAKKGDRVEVVGSYETLKQGEKVFEARTVTNVATNASFTNDDDGRPKGKKGKRGKGKDKDDFKGKDKKDKDDFEDKDDGRPAGKGGPGDLDRRVRALERKMDRLVEELRRSRGEKLKAPPRQE
jgi:hypothetical protein